MQEISLVNWSADWRARTAGADVKTDIGSLEIPEDTSLVYGRRRRANGTLIRRKRAFYHPLCRRKSVRIGLRKQVMNGTRIILVTMQKGRLDWGCIGERCHRVSFWMQQAGWKSRALDNGYTTACKRLLLHYLVPAAVDVPTLCLIGSLCNLLFRSYSGQCTSIYWKLLAAGGENYESPMSTKKGGRCRDPNGTN